MTVSLKEQLATIGNVRDERVLRETLGAIVDSIQAIAAKLDADAGVTDTNYAATVATLVTD